MKSPHDQRLKIRPPKRGNSTHESKTDKDAFLYKKSDGTAAKLAYLGHILIENRNGLVTDAQVTQATGTANGKPRLAWLKRSVARIA